MPTFDRHLLRAWFAALCVAMLLAGCAQMTRKPSPTQQAQAARAQQLYRQGHFNDAAQVWKNLAANNRGLRDSALLSAAGAYRQLDDFSRAAPLLQRIDRDRLSVAQAQRYDLLSAEAALNQGAAQRALVATQAMSAFPAPLQPRVLELRARAQKALGQALAAARTRLTLDQGLSGFDRSQNEQQLLALLHAADSATLQSAARALAVDDPLRPWLAQALASKGLGVATTLPQLDRPVGTMRPGSDQVDVREGYRPPADIAVLLPVSGQLAAAAKALLHGFRTAAHADPKRAASTTVTVYDSGGTPIGALAGYRHAVADGVDIVVGPLSRDAVGLLFQQPLPVHVLALNHPDNGVPPPASAEFALPPEADGAHAAARMRMQGLTSAIMFVGEGDSAQRAARAFRAQFEAMGGHVVGSATLGRNRVDYTAAIEQLMTAAGIVPAAHGISEFDEMNADHNPDDDAKIKPPVDVSATMASIGIGSNTQATTGIFLALRPRQGRLLVPQLNIARITVPVIATSHIYSVRTDQALNRDLDGVVFCDAPWLFDAQPGLPLRSQLAATMPDTVGPAARLFAFGMDAWSLLPYLDWLRTHPGSYLAGATGQLTMDSFGRVRRTPIWAKFVDGIAVPVTGALDARRGRSSARSSSMPSQH